MSLRYCRSLSSLLATRRMHAVLPLFEAAQRAGGPGVATVPSLVGMGSP